MSKSEIWKEKTAWRFWNTCNSNNKKIVRFLFIILWWKLKTYFIGTFTCILAYVTDIIIFLSAKAFESFVFVVWPELTCNIIHLLFSIARPVVGKLISLLPARPVGKIMSHLPTRSAGPRDRLKPVQTSTLLW